jgi:hypothetical protein
MWLGLAAMGLATAAFADVVDFAAKPDDARMNRAITRQRIAAGQQVQARPRQDTPLTVDQMLAAAASYEPEMARALEHGENLRLHAYRARDLIFMTCVDEKLGQIKEILYIAQPRFSTIKTATHDELSMRSQFTTLREGWERINQLSAEMESCIGDGSGPVYLPGLAGEETGPGAAVDDPTMPPNPNNIVDRPGYASPFR